MKPNKVYAWLVVGLLWVVALLNYMDRQMLSTMKPSMQIDIKELQQAATFGNLMAIFLLVYGCVSPFSGIIADRVNRKWLIIISLFVWSAVTFLMGYATTFNQLYWLRALMGVSEAMYIPAGLSLIADYHSSATRSLAIGVHMTGIYMGQALGGFGATVAHVFSWQQAFHVFGLIGIVYSFILILFLKECKVPAEAANFADTDNPPFSSLFSGVKQIVSNKYFWVILCFFAVSSLPGWGVKNWLPTLFADNLQLSMSVAGPIATITIAVSSLIGVLGGGFLSDKWVQNNLRARVYTSAIGLNLTIPALLLLGFGNSLFHLMGAAFCFGIGFGMFDANNMPIVCQFIAPAYRATAYGIMNMVGVFAGSLVTNWLGKSVDKGSLGKDFAALALVVALAAALQYFMLRPKSIEYEN
ncbi:MAG: MFS transporter [Bacteroidetes bacterium]|nr:MFS transporter [Bacteroidota bacterium]